MWNLKGGELTISTKFFYKVASHRKNSNDIYGLLINGSWTQDQMIIPQEIEAYYMKLFEETHYSRPIPAEMEFEHISDNDKRSLEKPFSEEEINGAIWGMKGDNSPGLDGFTISFYHHCWDIIKAYLLRVFEDFYISEEFYEHINNT